jgi:D-alanyl-D-alanine carboxypeptidase (penicillin-binding protein 5/6)
MQQAKIIGASFGIGLFFLAALALRGGFEQFLFMQMTAPFQGMVYAQLPAKPDLPALELDAKAALSLRVNYVGRERFVFSKSPNEKLPIASITKLMTALVVFENPADYNLDRKVTVSKAAAGQDDVPLFGNLKTGEIYTVKDLLGMMMYYSSNDAAYALADVVGVDKFTNLMNSKAVSLGLANTHFVNPNGLDGNGMDVNTSSAADLVALARYIIKAQPGIFVFSLTPGPYASENGIFNVALGGGRVLAGGKTGFTDIAGGCMLLAFRDEKNNYYFNVLLGSLSSPDRVVQMQKLVDYDNNVTRY